MKVRVDIPSANEMIRRLGLGEDGAVQKFHTANVNRRIGRYMPHLTGTLETKLKHISSSTEIEVLGPYARYQYYGKVMVNAKTGNGPAFIPGVGPRYKKRTILKVTDRSLEYTRTHNLKAGPFWDRALVAAEGDAIVADLQDFIKRRQG